LGFGQVEGGDLEAVDEQAGALRVDGVEGDAAEDLGEAELDGGAVFKVIEGLEAEVGMLFDGVAFEDWLAVGVVVVTEVFVEEGARAAAVSVCEDVTAEVGLGVPGWVDFDDFSGGELVVRHGFPLCTPSPRGV
jgi:hypothetical protein